MAGGPAAEVKNASVEKDASFSIHETFGDLLTNFFIVAVVAATVWFLVTGVRFSIKYGSDYLFTPYAELYEESEEATESKREVRKNLIETDQKYIEEITLTGKGFSLKESPYKNDLTKQAYLIFAVLLLSALIRGILLQIPSWKSSEGDGMAKSLEFYHATYDCDDQDHKPRYDKPTFVQAVRRVILTSLTVGCGGSGGIEAPVVPIGECIGAGWAKFLKVVRSDDLRIYQMAGMAAAVTTLLDAPFTSALFAAEIVYNARILYRPLMYSLIGAMVAFALNNHFLHFQPLFTPRAHSMVYTIQEYIEVSIVALICSAPASIGLAILFKKLKTMINPFPSIVRPIIGAIGTGSIGLGIWFGLGLEPQHVLGVSEETIIQVMAGDGNPLLKLWYILALLVVAKAFATGFTLMAGGSAGALVPAMFLGGVTGGAIFQFITAMGLKSAGHIAVFVVAGLASALVAVVHVPLAAIALVMEIFGAVYGPPAIISCVLTYLLARRWQLYITT